MFMTRETDYALRMMRALAAGELLTVRQICEQEKIPVQFAYKILKKLSKAHYIQIIRGAAGGYRLTANLRELTLLQMFQAMEEQGILTACLTPDYSCSHNAPPKKCQWHDELFRIQKMLHQELERRSLDEILQQ